MALLSATDLTLADWAKRQDPKGGVAVIAEMLSQTNEILDDAVFMEGNLPTGHQVTIRTGLPDVYYRAINQGVPRSKSTTAQVTEACSMLEARSQIDKDEASLNGDTAAYKMSENKPFVQAMSQQMAETMIYGDPAVDSKQYLGLASRYSNLSAAGNSDNVISAGGAGSDNTSVYLVVWGKETVFCPFPKGSSAGLQFEDIGLDDALDADGNEFRAYKTHYQWKSGLVVKDWRYVVRICNIDVSDLNGVTGTQAVTAATWLPNLMFDAVARIPDLGAGKACFYMNRTVHTGLGKLALAKSVSVLAIEEGLNQFGKAAKWTSFQGIPLRKVDRILNTETVVS